MTAGPQETRSKGQRSQTAATLCGQDAKQVPRAMPVERGHTHHFRQGGAMERNWPALQDKLGLVAA